MKTPLYYVHTLALNFLQILYVETFSFMQTYFGKYFLQSTSHFFLSQIFLKRRKKVFRIENFLGPELASLYVVKFVV